jgi:mRNA export factor
MLSNAFRAPAKDIELVQPPTDSISKIAFSPTSDILAVASWDNGVCAMLTTQSVNMLISIL